jgi:hypothetical protein
MARGGARPGAGRKRKRPLPGMPDPEINIPGSPIKLAESKLRQALPDLTDIAIQKAKDGDNRMLVYCIDRVLGSPVQPIDLEVSRAAARLAAAIGADPEFLIRRAQQLAAENSEAVTG